MWESKDVRKLSAMDLAVDVLSDLEGDTASEREQLSLAKAINNTIQEWLKGTDKQTILFAAKNARAATQAAYAVAQSAVEAAKNAEQEANRVVSMLEDVLE